MATVKEPIRSAVSVLRGFASLSAYGLNTVFWAVPIVFLALFKRVMPSGRWRNSLDRLQNALAEGWVSVNLAHQRLFSPTRWTVHLPDSLNRRGWYLVIANHRSWVDILVLQRIFHRKIPFLKFFLKKELFWVPVLGQGWWALDFPFMKRYPRRYLEKHPDRVGRDLDITRRACEKFKRTPISVMNFVEGTRFTAKKHAVQSSPYRNLLRGRAGGAAYILSSLSDRIRAVLDVTIVYPKGRVSFWAFVCGRVEEVRVSVRAVPLIDDLVGDYARDPIFRLRFQRWLNDLWSEKDRCIDRLSHTAGSGAEGAPVPESCTVDALEGLR